MHRTADFKAILVQLDERLGCALGIGVEFLSVQRRVAEEFKHRTMKLICAGSCSNGNVGPGISTLFRSGVRRGYLELLNVVRVETENVVRWIRVGGFVGFNAINGDVHCRRT